jgi:hypothetical protein
MSLKWEKIDSNPTVERTGIVGGWLVRSYSVSEGVALAFVPDPKHEWKTHDKGSAYPMEIQ